MKTHSFLFLGILSLGLLCTNGCGGGPSNPPTHPVSGTVTLGGTPVADASVTFSPSAGQKPANGKTDSAGRYTLSTFDKNDGAMEGDYGVMIVKYQSSDAAATADVDSDDYDPTAVNDAEPKNELDEKYERPETSGLTATVSAGDGNTFDFELE